MSGDWTVTGEKPGTDDIITSTEPNRSAAEERKEKAEDAGLVNVEIIPPESVAADGGVNAEVVDHGPGSDGDETHPLDAEPHNADVNTPESKGPTDEALAELGESLDSDPLDILPGYMITEVEGEPTLNKRGVSVLAFHFNVSVLGYEVMAHPHETDFEYCSMRFTVERGGKEYVGHGEAHSDEVDKSKLLRMAETRAYKRAVIFATGTGIVGYQEVMGELQ